LLTYFATSDGVTSGHSPSPAGHVATCFTTPNCAMLCYPALSRAIDIASDTAIQTQSLVVSMSGLPTSAISVSTAINNNFLRSVITDKPNQWSRNTYLCTTTPPLPLQHFPLLDPHPQQPWK
jgi:hypothetical protein